MGKRGAVMTEDAVMRASISPFPTGHKDIVLDLEYDFYGNRLVTCSADRHVKVFDWNAETQQWDLNDSWQAHRASIVRVGFASPEFGQLLLSCSYDRIVRVWEENVDTEKRSGRRWKLRKELTDATGPLYDACFLPSFLGLKIGTIGADRIVRVYENTSPGDLTDWELCYEVPPIELKGRPIGSNLQSDFNICWCPSQFSCEKICVSILDSAYIYYRSENSSQFVLGAVLPGNVGLIRSVAWAPTMGRSYHLIALACKDGYVRIYKLVEKVETTGEESFDISVIWTYPEEGTLKDNPRGEVWRVAWNQTGSILCSCGDDGLVRLFKCTHADNFECVGIVGVQQ